MYLVEHPNSGLTTNTYNLIFLSNFLILPFDERIVLVGLISKITSEPILAVKFFNYSFLIFNIFLFIKKFIKLAAFIEPPPIPAL